MEHESLHVSDHSNERRYFTIVPNYVIDRLSGIDMALYCHMKRYAGENGTCYKSKKNLCESLRIGKSTLKESISALYNFGFIEPAGKKIIQTEGGPQMVDCFKICDIWKLNISKYDKGVSIQTTLSKGGLEQTKGGSETEKGGFNQPTKKNVLLNNNKEHIQDVQKIPERGFTTEEPSSKPLDRFREFWGAYPKKEAEEKAKREWRRLTVYEKNDAIADLGHRKWSSYEFTPLASSYLKDKRWKDEKKQLASNSSHYDF